MVTEQISIFDIEHFELKQKVAVVIPEAKRNDPESYHYLQKFEGQDGVVSKVIEWPSLQYQVLYGSEIACVYHDELIAL